MPIIKCEEHIENYSVVSNSCFKTATLTAQAMGVYAYLMTLPADWKINKTEIVSHFANGRDAIYKAFDELIEAGYIKVEKKRNEQGRFTTVEYTVHEESTNGKSDNGKTVSSDSVNGRNNTTTNGKPLTETPPTENPSLLNTNKLSTNNQLSKSHSSCSAGSKENSKKDSNSYPEESYKQVFDIYFDNYKSLYKKGLIKNEKPVLPVFVKQTVKAAFKNYGVENVLKAVRDSVNHTWLVENQYPFLFIFGKNELPMLINGIHEKTKPKQTVYTFNRTEDKYDMSDMAI